MATYNIDDSNSGSGASFSNTQNVVANNDTITWTVGGFVDGEDLSKSDTVPQAIVDKINFVLPAVKDAFQLALKNDVNIAFGTDSGVSRHGVNAREFELMVDYGMDNETALKTATINAAKLLGLDSQIGTITVGKTADIIAIKGNPLKDIAVMHDVVMVVKGGKQYK